MPRREPERTCIVTRTAGAPAELIRFVVAPSGEVVPDLRGRLPGRGAWVSARKGAVAEAVRRRLFARAFKAEVVAPPDLAETIERTLVADLRQALSLANKAGCVAAGFGKVEDALGSGEAVALVHASDAAEDGRRKLAGALRKRLGDAISRFPVVDELSSEELGLALGRSHVIHAALVAGPGSDGFLMRWRRLRRYRDTDADSADLEREADGPELIEPAGSQAE